MRSRNSSGLFSSGSKRADSGRINGEGGILFCTGRRMSIFDSLVLDSRSQTGLVRLRLYRLRRDEIRSGFQNAISQRKIELCVICLFSLEKRLKIGRTCVGLRAETDYRMVRFCRPRSGVRRKLFGSRTDGAARVDDPGYNDP